MRYAIAALVAAGLAMAPAVAQDTNEANTAVVTEPGTTEDNVNRPVLPITDEANTAAPVPAPVVEPPLEPEPLTANRDRGRFPWGLLGLIGLVGLLGRVRS